MHEPLRLSLTAPFQEALQKLGVTTTREEIYNALVEPPNTDMGHLAFGCFIAAKSLKKSPAAVATDLKASLTNVAGTSSIEAAGPYLNIKFNSENLARHTVQAILSQEVFKRVLTTDAPKTMIEYSQPNTHKEIHVGHMRNLCLGDSLIRLLRRTYGEDKIISSTFPGDVGTHVAKCLWYIKNYVGLDVLAQKRTDAARGEWLGQMYSAANIKLEDEEKTTAFEKNKGQLTEILKQLEAGRGEFYDLWKETREWSIELMKKVYQWAGVGFDKWYWESDVDADSVKTIKKYHAEGKLQESQGTIGLDFSNENLGFCMLLKTDGTGLYATKDIELARRKFEDYKIEKSIYVVDMRQALHFKQVFKALEVLGFDQAKNCYHLQYNFVELPDGAMSSRKGNIVPLMLLVDKMKAHVKAEYLSRYAGEWSAEEVETTADIVAKGAIKYGMVRQDTNKKIVFDMNEWLKLDGESGPFIQYSSSRILSLLKKFKQDSNDFDGTLLVHAAEVKLMQHLMNFNTVVLSSAENYKPATLCTYLYETAKKFNVFYHDCPIGTAENVELRKARLALSGATGLVLKNGLALLGIPVPERM
ncbi:MAG: arginine--tRNA ligase [Bdellovibrionaceae bacterium]|nr:arginine--tRNA ligase [Bdellovibrio sp.]